MRFLKKKFGLLKMMGIKGHRRMGIIRELEHDVIVFRDR